MSPSRSASTRRPSGCCPTMSAALAGHGSGDLVDALLDRGVHFSSREDEAPVWEYALVAGFGNALRGGFSLEHRAHDLERRGVAVRFARVLNCPVPLALEYPCVHEPWA